MLLILYLAFLIFAILFSILLILFYIEAGITFFRRTAPQLPSERKLRDAVVSEIRKHYPDARTAIDIGSGWGGMARRIAREFPNMRVVGVELMPLAFACSRLARLFLGPRNCRFVMGDAIKYAARAKNKQFDIAVCYSGDRLMKAVAPLAGRFKVVLSLDFPMPGKKAARVIKLHKDRLGQHMLYVYK